MNVNVISTKDDLTQLVHEINSAEWDDANEMTAYEEGALRTYLERPDTVFIACHDESSKCLMGIASGRIEMKPYDHELWLYVDEVDVCADQRQRGAGKAMMKALLGLAEEHGCEELWLGTEVDNDAANALYSSLDPDDIEQVVGYTWETDE